MFALSRAHSTNTHSNFYMSIIWEVLLANSRGLFKPHVELYIYNSLILLK